MFVVCLTTALQSDWTIVSCELGRMRPGCTCCALLRPLCPWRESNRQLPNWSRTANCSRLYRVILSVLDQRKCEYLKDYSLDFEHAYMTSYLASWKACRYYRRCWKCSPPLSRQSWTRRFMFAKVACKTSSLIAAISRRMLFSSSCMVRVLLA